MARSGVFVLAPASDDAMPPPTTTLPQVVWALERARNETPRLFAGGHSVGAAIVLDALDPAAGRLSTCGVVRVAARDVPKNADAYRFDTTMSSARGWRVSGEAPAGESRSKAFRTGDLR